MFVRFNKFANGKGWDVDKNKWDAIIFTPKKDVKIFGIGIFSPEDNKPHNFTLTYKWLI